MTLFVPGVRELEWCWFYGVAGSSITWESEGLSVELTSFVPILNDAEKYLYFAGWNSKIGSIGVSEVVNSGGMS